MKHSLKTGYVILAALLLAGCARVPGNRLDAAPKAADQSDKRPAARPASLQTATLNPAQSAKTAEQFDTTTSEQRSHAVQPATPVGGERRLGATVGTLGNPAESGFWLKTPLVSKPGKGRVEYPATGKSVAVDLVPIDGPKTAGSRVSLATLRLLGAPLTGLPDLIVYTN